MSPNYITIATTSTSTNHNFEPTPPRKKTWSDRWDDFKYAYIFAAAMVGMFIIPIYIGVAIADLIFRIFYKL